MTERPLPLPRLLLIAAVTFYAVVLLRHAWVCDDAYITFRTVKNLLEGRGLTWNFGQRVQAYTHPLWMLLVALVVSVGDGFYYSVIGLSSTLSIAAVALFGARVARTPAAALLAIAVLVSSKAFMDYSSSGLENPLTHLLYVVFLIVALDQQTPGEDPANQRFSRRLLVLSLLAAFMATNRLDTLALVAPVLVFESVQLRRHRALLLRTLACGFAPMFAWELFSLAYYGFLVPNTAFAKLGAGVPAGVLWRQGGYYYVSQLGQDPITLLVMGLGLFGTVAAFVRARVVDPRLAGVALGVTLYLLYILRIGGDFMLGRFFAAPLLGGLALLIELVPWSEASPRLPGALAPALVVLALGVALTPRPTLTSNSLYSVTSPPGANAFDDRGVNDERAYYYQNSGLLRAAREKRMPADDRMNLGATLAPDKVSRRWAVGFIGFTAHPRAIIVDELGLADPLLARLPTTDPNFRIGHMPRAVPDGYVETLETGRNQIKDPTIAALWDRLSLVISGPLWRWERWKAIAALNFNR